MENNEAIKKFFKVFEVIVSFMVVNLLMLVGSFFSLLILTPVLIYSSFKMMDQLLMRDFDDLLFNFFINIKNHFLQTFKIGFPIIIAIGFIVFMFITINPLIIDLIPITIYGVIIGSQLLLMYIFVSALLIYFIALIDERKEIGPRKLLLIIFFYPFSTVIGFLSMFLIPSFLISISGYFLLVIIPLGVNGYYVLLYKKVKGLHF